MADINLYYGDCLNIMNQLSDKSIDCIICDLPYGTTACSWDIIIPFDKLWEQYNRIIKQQGAIILFGQEPFSSMVRTSQLNLYRYEWIWQKQRPSNFQQMGYQCGRITENIMIFSKSNAVYSGKNQVTMNYYPQMETRDKSRISPKDTIQGQNNIIHNYNGSGNDEYKVYNEKFPTNIIKFNTVEGKDRVHPTQKPIDLLEYLIKTYTKENELVLDNCMGSGSTGVACKLLNRDFIGIELDKNYYNIAENRINNTTQNNKGTVKENNHKLLDLINKKGN